MSLIFVYGTLKRGGSNHSFLSGQKFLGDARTAPGYRLFELDGFPGMVAKLDDRAGVTGEVWSVNDACLATLDRLEGIDEGLYRRERVRLLAPFVDQAIETYVYAREVNGRRELGSEWKE
ncbi:MAG: hypothetical protein JWM35_2223 [Verrucomicrobia bacterium]|nr:hypothetical protein [Verrucomicrobiota bacterium]